MLQTICFMHNFESFKRIYLWLIVAPQILFCNTVFSAEPYPVKPISFIVTSSPGGGTDAMARLLAESMSNDLGQSIVVENVPGAGGAIGAGVVARSKPDGYKVLFTTGGFVIAPLLLPNAGYDPLKQFSGVRQIATVPLVIVVKGESSLNSISDLILFAKRGNPISYASFGVGTPSHIAGEAMKKNSKVEFTHIPYAGSSKALPDIQSERVTFGILDASFAIPMIQQGVLKPLAVTGRHRLHSLPNTPTLLESGIPFDLVGWYGVFVAKGTEPEIVNKLHSAFDRAIAKPAIAHYIKSSGLVYVDGSMSSDQWTKKYLAEMRQWDGLIKELNIAKD